MAAVKLVVGHIVKLKSGGPWMTVTKDRLELGSKFVQASWFSGAELKTEVFHKDALELDPASVPATPAE